MPGTRPPRAWLLHVLDLRQVLGGGESTARGLTYYNFDIAARLNAARGGSAVPPRR